MAYEEESGTAPVRITTKQRATRRKARMMLRDSEATPNEKQAEQQLTGGYRLSMTLADTTLLGDTKIAPTLST